MELWPLCLEDKLYPLSHLLAQLFAVGERFTPVYFFLCVVVYGGFLILLCF